MDTNKYILCGGEDLCHTYEGCGISEKGKDLFNKWAIKSLADPCLHEKEAFLDMQVSSERRLLIRAVRERNKGSRTLTWYLGIELSKEDIRAASCYANLIRGLLAIPLESIKNLRNSEFLSVNLQHPSGFPQIQTPFEELKGKNFYGEYPRVLWDFCQKISLNDIEDWFDRLFLAVNVEVAYSEYTNMICEVPPQVIVQPAPPPQKPSELSSVPGQYSKASSENKGERGKMKNFFLCLLGILTIIAVCYSIDQHKKLSDNIVMLEEKDKIHQGEITELKSSHNTAIAEKEQKIKELEEEIVNLSAPKDIEKILNDIEAKINTIEKVLKDLEDNYGPRLDNLGEHLQNLKKKCVNKATKSKSASE